MANFGNGSSASVSAVSGSSGRNPRSPSSSEEHGEQAVGRSWVCELNFCRRPPRALPGPPSPRPPVAGVGPLTRSHAGGGRGGGRGRGRGGDGDGDDADPFPRGRHHASPPLRTPRWSPPRPSPGARLRPAGALQGPPRGETRNADLHDNPLRFAPLNIPGRCRGRPDGSRSSGPRRPFEVVRGGRVPRGPSSPLLAPHVLLGADNLRRCCCSVHRNRCRGCQGVRSSSELPLPQALAIFLDDHLPGQLTERPGNEAVVR